MSTWLVNPGGNIPFASNLASSSTPYGYYSEQQAAIAQQAPGIVPDGFTTQRVSGVPSQQVAGTSYQPVSTPWQQHSSGLYGHSWTGQQPLAGQLISTPQVTIEAQTAAIQSKLDEQAKKVQDLERELQLARSQLEKQQQQGRALAGQVEGLTAELAAERQRADELARQLHDEIASHHALKADHDCLITQHASLVREHEHMVSSQAATMRELEGRHADVSRLQRQLEEAQAAAQAAVTSAAASIDAAAAAAGFGTHSGGGGAHPSGSSDSLHRTSPRGAHASLSAAEGERWALRLHKAERALEEERRVSEDLRQQLASAEAEARAATKRLRQLEVQLLESARAGKPAGDGSPGQGGMVPANSDPLPRSPVPSSPRNAVLSPTASSRPAAPKGWFSGSHGTAAAGAAGGGTPGAAPGQQLANPFAAVALTGGDAGGQAPQISRPEDQVARLKKEVETLRADLTRMVVSEEGQRVTARAAEDRARAAELVSLDVRRQCDQAARTIGRLIDENNELVVKVNAQANVLSDCKAVVAAKEAELRALGARLAQVQAHLAAQAQAQVQSPPPKHVDLSSMHQQHHGHQQPVGGQNKANGTWPAASPTHGSAGTVTPQQYGQSPQHHHRPIVQPPKILQQLPPPQLVGPKAAGGSSAAAREVLMAGDALTEADWKLVMLSEEVRRLVEEVSMATTACLELERKSGCDKQPPQEHGNGCPRTADKDAAGAAGAAAGAPVGSASTSASSSPPPDLPRILSRLEGLSGRRLSPGETAAYIIELAGHMEALEQVLQQKQQRMGELRAPRGPGPEAWSGPGPGDGEVGPRSGPVGEAGRQAAPASEGPQDGSQMHLRAGQGAVAQGQGQHVHQEGHQALYAGTQLEAGDQQQQQQRAQPQHDTQQGQQAAMVHEGQRPHSQHERSVGLAAASSTAAVVGEGSDASRGPSAGAQPGTSGGSSAEAPSSGATAAASTDEERRPTGASSHVVSPFNQLTQPREAQSPAPQPSSGSLLEGADGQPPPPSTRAEFAAAAAAAVAAATSDSATNGPRAAAPQSGAVVGEINSSGNGGVLAMVLPPYEAPPSPRSAPLGTVGSVAISTGSPVAAVVVQSPEVDDDLLDEAVAGKIRPRRARVGLWGWISGETSR